MKYFIVISIACCILAGCENVVLAVDNYESSSQRSLTAWDGSKSSARGDWYNEIGFPQQFFFSRWAIFNVWLFYMLVFLKIFLLLGIWNPSKEEEQPYYLYGGHDSSYQYYTYPSLPTYD